MSFSIFTSSAIFVIMEILRLDKFKQNGLDSIK